MKILYIDPTFGASGDMLIAALIDAGLKKDFLESSYKKLKIGRVKVKTEKVIRCGIRATRVNFAYRSSVRFDRFESIIDGAQISPEVQKRTKKVLKLIKRTEAKIHGQDCGLHELDALDTLLDVFGFSDRNRSGHHRHQPWSDALLHLLRLYSAQRVSDCSP
ncbi:MAG TPA: DUF111 family protein [bacterium (Candidatus Stahlbacteria)]|nr:DUF111 family protein [Candidatus Stahlbacteria bacterium]